MGADSPLHAAICGPYATKAIRIQAIRLSRCPGFSRSEIDDLKQEIWMRVERRIDRLDPAQAAFETYVSRLVEWAAGQIYRDRLRLKRGAGRPPGTLDAPLRRGEPEGPRRVDHMTQSDARCHAGLSGLTGDQVSRMRQLDLHSVVEGIPEHLLPLARELTHRTPNAAAEALGISRRQVANGIEELRRHFERRLGGGM